MSRARWWRCWSRTRRVWSTTSRSSASGPRVRRGEGLRTVIGKILVANRGEVAIGLGPPQATSSYLNIPAVISAAELSAADAIHPGYGFLAENARFAEICEACNIKFIGPTSSVLARMGDKAS